MEKVQKAGRFYTGIIMKNIGIFIFIGILSVVFQTDGWFPNENMYAISKFAYWYILPGMIAYAGGSAVGGANGGIVAVMGICGILVNNPQVGIFSAMLTAPLCGILWKQEEKLLKEKGKADLQMLFKNLMMGVTGCICAAIEYYILAYVLDMVAKILERGVDLLVAHHCIPLLSILIEPAKVFFMNNLINHGILVPLGMAQTAKTGYSALFLLEVNPGPGLGLLLALWWTCKKRRETYITAAFAEAVGGIHEVYFPFVLEDIRLLIPLIAGGMAGSAWFTGFHCGVQSAVSPGSVITVLLMAGRQKLLWVMAGICVSMLVTFGVTVCMMRMSVMRMPEKEQAADKKVEEQQSENGTDSEWKKKEQTGNMKIVFVCSGGMGSSAMGAALCRRTFAEQNVTGTEITAQAADMLTGDVDLVICQEDFYRLTPELKNWNCYRITSFVAKEEYIKLAEAIKK